MLPNRGSISLLLLSLLAIILVSVGAFVLGRTVLNGAYAANGLDETYTGILIKNEDKCKTTGEVLCYKLFRDDGQNVLWVSRDTTKFPDRASFEAFLGKRVLISKGALLTYKDKPYLLAKSVRPASNDNLFTIGLTGGYYDEMYQGDRDNLGVSVLGAAVAWTYMEPQKGDPYNFHREWDENLARCQKFGYQCTIIFDNQPTWLTENYRKSHPASCATFNGVKAIDPEDYDSFKNMVKAVAERYDGDGVNDGPGHPKAYAIELYNEVTIATPANPCGLTPEELSQQMGLFYAAIKEVSTLGVSFTRSKASNSADREWMEKVVQQPNGCKFDYMNLHYYDTAEYRDQWGKYDPIFHSGVRGQVSEVNKITSRCTGSPKPIIYSEMGRETLETPDSQIVQARQVFKLFTQMFSTNTVTMAQWWKLVSPHPKTDPGPNYYGLLLYGKPTKAYAAYGALAKNLNGSRFLSFKKADLAFIEGYVFRSSTGKRSDVMWKNKQDPAAPDKTPSVVYKNVGSLMVTGADDAVARLISDNGVGDTDKVPSQITLLVTDQPILVSSNAPAFNEISEIDE